MLSEEVNQTGVSVFPPTVPLLSPLVWPMWETDLPVKACAVDM